MKKINLPCLVLILVLSLAAACGNPSTPVNNIDTTSSTGNISTAQAPLAIQPQEYKPAQSVAEVLPDYPVTVTDDLGRKVTINKQPQRIVSLAPSNTEILFALGLDDKIIGVTDYCNYPEAAKMKTRVAGYSTPDLERLVTLQPDLVVAESIQEKTVLPALEKLGMTVFVAEATTMDSILNHISALGKITGKPARAAQLLETMNSKINNVVSRTRDLTTAQRPRVFYVNWHDPIWTMGRNTYINDVINKAGGTNIYESDFEKSRAVSLESVITKNPQVIFVSGMGTAGDKVLNGIKDEVRLYSVDAVKNNRIYKISDANIIERPGPRITDGLMEIARMVHPEIFGDLK
ncbi:MAG: cobalamin-binding protein [Dehalococcoidia bacterium]|nr:MAG: cobalamin-binding protein [Dehalococcoidia bacterium]